MVVIFKNIFKNNLKNKITYLDSYFLLHTYVQDLQRTEWFFFRIIILAFSVSFHFCEDILPIHNFVSLFFLFTLHQSWKREIKMYTNTYLSQRIIFFLKEIFFKLNVCIVLRVIRGLGLLVDQEISICLLTTILGPSDFYNRYHLTNKNLYRSFVPFIESGRSIVYSSLISFFLIFPFYRLSSFY